MVKSQAKRWAVFPNSRRANPLDEGLEEQAVQAQSGKTFSIAYRGLGVYGFDTSTNYQRTFLNYPLTIFAKSLEKVMSRSPRSRKYILTNFEGVVTSGEMLLVLGRPGSGCTTLLRTLTGDTYGLHIDSASLLNYQGNSYRGVLLQR